MQITCCREHSTIKCVYEYKRLSAVSLTAGIDLQTGVAVPLVRDSHNSADSIDFLKEALNKSPHPSWRQISARFVKKS